MGATAVWIRCLPTGLASLLAVAAMVGCEPQQPPPEPSGSEQAAPPATALADTQPADEPATAPATSPAETATEEPEPTPDATTAPASDQPVETQPAAANDRLSDEPKARLKRIEGLYHAGRFREAFKLARRTQVQMAMLSRTDAFGKLRRRVVDAHRSAHRLQQAVDLLGSPDEARANVGLEMLRQADSEPARILLRQALRGDDPNQAGRAATLLAAQVPEQAMPTLLTRLERAEQPAMAYALAPALMKHVEAIPQPRLTRMARQVLDQQAQEPETAETAAAQGSKRDGAGDAAETAEAQATGHAVQTAKRRVRLAVLGKTFAERFSHSVSDFEQALGGAVQLSQLMDAADQSFPQPEQREEHPKIAAALAQLAGVVDQDFDELSPGDGLDALKGWRAGELLAKARIDADPAYDTGNGTDGRSLYLEAKSSRDDRQPVLLLELGPGVSRGTVTFEYKFWETTHNTDGNLWLVNARGKHVIGVGTENPEWEVVVGDKEVVNHRRRGDEYQHWIHVVLTVDTEQDRARVSFHDTQDSSRKSYGWFDLPETDRLTELGIGPSRYWNVDDIRIYPGPPRQNVSP